MRQRPSAASSGSDLPWSPRPLSAGAPTAPGRQAPAAHQLSPPPSLDRCPAPRAPGTGDMNHPRLLSIPRSPRAWWVSVHARARRRACRRRCARHRPGPARPCPAAPVQPRRSAGGSRPRPLTQSRALPVQCSPRTVTAPEPSHTLPRDAPSPHAPQHAAHAPRPHGFTWDRCASSIVAVACASACACGCVCGEGTG